MESIRLYTQSVNPFSAKVSAALRLKQLPYERVISENPEDFKRWNPVTARLPVLEIDGERRHDSTAIIDWLDDRFPEHRLYSLDAKTAASQRSLAEWVDASFLFYWDQWRQARFPQPGDEEPVQPGLLGHASRWVGLVTSTPSRGTLRELEVLDELAHRMDDLVGMLGERPFFQAHAVSVADLSVYGMMRVVRDGPMPTGAELIAERPVLRRFVERMDALIGDDTVGYPTS